MKKIHLKISLSLESIDIKFVKTISFCNKIKKIKKRKERKTQSKSNNFSILKAIFIHERHTRDQTVSNKKMN